jgi:hypothetical protein
MSAFVSFVTTTLSKELRLLVEQLHKLIPDLERSSPFDEKYLVDPI